LVQVLPREDTHPWNKPSMEEVLQFRCGSRNFHPQQGNCCSWCDRDLSQIDAVKQLVELYVENKVSANKQNAASILLIWHANLKFSNKFKEHTQFGTYRLRDVQ
jgi:hypothetical protein